MRNYIKVKVKHTLTDEAGKQKRSTDEYIFDAMTCQEGMIRAVRHFESCLKDWTIQSLGESNINETVITGVTGIFYRLSVKYTTESDSGKEVTSNSVVLVEAGSILEADSVVRDLNQDSAIPFEIMGNNKSKITEVVYVETDVRIFPLDDMFCGLLKSSGIRFTYDKKGVYVDLNPLTESERGIIIEYQMQYRMAHPGGGLLEMPEDD